MHACTVLPWINAQKCHMTDMACSPDQAVQVTALQSCNCSHQESQTVSSGCNASVFR